jgi:AcrR family transcriptional regulator
LREADRQDDDPTMMALGTLGMKGVPSSELDIYLDATARCIVRYGLGRVSVQDVAREVGVDRTTVYRKVGPMKNQLRLLTAREISRLLALVPAVEAPATAEVALETLARIIEAARSHPVLNRVVREDADTLSLADLHQMQRSLEASARALTPVIAATMRTGGLAQRDPAVISAWLVQTVVWLVMAPPDRDIRDVLREVVAPVLTPVTTQPGEQPLQAKIKAMTNSKHAISERT